MNDEIKELMTNIIYNEDVNGFICTDERYKEIKNYITNLQQNYDNNINKYEELIEKYSNLQQEFKAMQQENENIRKLKERYQLEKEYYKSRIDKASEYILDHHPDNSILPQGLWLELLYILQGDSNE